MSFWKLPALNAFRAFGVSRHDDARKQTFERVFEDNVDFVCVNARRLGVCEADVEDVAQHVFVVAYKKIGEFEGRASVKTWLFSILLRAASEHRRSARRKRWGSYHETSDPELLADSAPASDPHECLERAEASRMIDELLDSLAPDKRAVFVMAELEQMTAGEISVVTGLDAKAVYSRLRAARIDFERAAERMRKRSVLGRRRRERS